MQRKRGQEALGPPRAACPGQPGPLWQYTDGTHGPEPHTVDGVGNCDGDQFNGSLEQLRKLWGVAT